MNEKSEQQLSSPRSDVPVTGTVLSSPVYDALKYVALVLLPAFSALYFGLGQIWGFPKIEEVVGSVAVLDAVLGMLLRQSNKNYMKSDARFDGNIELEERSDGGTTASMVLKNDPEEALQKEELTFKVEQDPTVVPVEVKHKRKRNSKGQFS